MFVFKTIVRRPIVVHVHLHPVASVSNSGTEAVFLVCWIQCVRLTRYGGVHARGGIAYHYLVSNGNTEDLDCWIQVCVCVGVEDDGGVNAHGGAFVSNGGAEAVDCWVQCTVRLYPMVMVYMPVLLLNARVKRRCPGTLTGGLTVFVFTP